MTEIKSNNSKERNTKGFKPLDFLKNNILSLPIIKFIIIGGINTLHHSLWNLFFVRVLKLNYMVSFVVAFFLAMTGSFFLNTYFTFRTKPSIKKFLEYPVTVLPNLLISMFNMKILIEYLKWPNFVSAILASLIAIPFTFLLTKFILTKNDRNDLDDDGGIPVTNTQGSRFSADIGNINQGSPSEVIYKKDNSGRNVYNFGRLSKMDPWLDFYDIVIFLVMILFAILYHDYIFKSEFLYGVAETDSTVQMIYFLPFIIKDAILGGNFWSWSYGMGGDIFSEFSFYYSTSPIIWLISPFLKFFPESIWSLENSLNLKLFISIFKQFLIMVSMYSLLRYEKKSKLSSFAAAVVYGGCLHYLWNSAYFDFFNDAMLWVPLMVLGMRIFQKRRNFWPLLFSASLSLINSFYFGFHNFMFFILFVLVMIVPEGKNLKECTRSWFKQFGSYAAIGLGSVLLSMVAFLPSLFAFLKIDRFDTVNPVNWIYGKEFFENMPLNLFFDNSFFGVPALIILFLFLNYRRTSNLTDRKVILLMITFILYCTPKTGYFLNGMNYESERWYYLVVFVMAYALADFLDEMKRPNFFNLFMFIIVSGAAGAAIYYNWDSLKELNNRNIHIIVLTANVLALLFIALRHLFKKIRIRRLLDFGVVAMVTTVMIFNGRAKGNDNQTNMNTETMKDSKMVSPELDDIMSRVVPKEDEFYRTVFRDTTYENTPTYYKYYGISTFASMTDGNMHDWLKRILDLRHNITYLSSFKNVDDRTYLEGLLGVKYIIAEKGYEPPANYKNVYSNELYNLFEAKESVGMDMWFTNTFPEGEMEKIGYAERDLQLFNYAVTDKPIEGFTDGPLIDSEHIAIDDKTMLLNGVDINIGENGEGYIKFKKGGFVTFKIPDPYPESQVYLHEYLRPKDKMDFSQDLNKKHIFKSWEHHAYIYYINDWTWAMNGSESQLVWKATEKDYELKNLTLSRIDLRDFGEVVKERNKYNMENLHVGKNSVTGTVNNKEKGIMVFNIPYNKGWHLKINGKPYEIHKMNGFLSGVVLEPGENHLDFKFTPRGLIPGAVISISTLIAGILLNLFLNKKYPFQINESEGTLHTFNSYDLYSEREENYGRRKVKPNLKNAEIIPDTEIQEEPEKEDKNTLLPSSYLIDIVKESAEASQYEGTFKEIDPSYPRKPEYPEESTYEHHDLSDKYLNSDELIKSSDKPSSEKVSGSEIKSDTESGNDEIQSDS